MHTVLERLLALATFSEHAACYLVLVAFFLLAQASCVLIATFRLLPSFWAVGDAGVCFSVEEHIVSS